MNFVKLSFDANYGNYDYREASNEEMSILGLFLTDDVGCKRGGSPTLAEWAFQDKWGTGFSSNATRVEKEGDFIFLSGVFPEEENPTKLKMSRRQFVDIIDEWFNKVCNNKPTIVLIKEDNGQFIMEMQN